MIDWYDKNQCHHNDVNGHDRTNGRIFKVSLRRDEDVTVRISPKLSSQALVEMQTSPERVARPPCAAHPPGARAERRGRARCSGSSSRDDPWPAGDPASHPLAQHAVGGLSDPRRDRAAARRPRSGDPRLDDPAGDRARAAARADPRPVRRAGADRSVAGRPALPGLGAAAAAARRALGHRSPAWSATPRTPPTTTCRSCTGTPPSRWPRVDASRAARLASASPIPLIQEFMARRIGAIGTPESLALLVDELGRAAGSARRSTLLTGIEEALRGRRQVAMPAAWPEVFASWPADPDREVRSRAMALARHVRRPGGARCAAASARRRARPTSASRREALAALLKVKDPSLAGRSARARARPGSSAARPCAGCRPTTIRRRPTS